MVKSTDNTIDIERAEDLVDSNEVFEHLESLDWSFTNEDTQQLTHDLHPYPAKFIPQIPDKLIRRLSLPGDLVCDPFGGCGTSAVEAVRLRRRALSCDANPLSALIGKAKVGYFSPDVERDIHQLRRQIISAIESSECARFDWVKDEMERLGHWCPPIPNIAKWFDPQVTAELCLLKELISSTETELGRVVADVALSKIITKVSNQESETRYVAVPRTVEPSGTLRSYLESVTATMATLSNSCDELQSADARFAVGDSRFELPEMANGEMVDLIVTSPPYPNATDYHLYHRFRMFWMGYDPRNLGKIEIGSHLRHQRNKSGFDEYCGEMLSALTGCHQILSPGRFAVLVAGSARFAGSDYNTAEAIANLAGDVGFNVVGTIDRPVHRTKRSFPNAGRRTATESLVILQKENEPVTVRLVPPDYRMWEYEAKLRTDEIKSLTGEAICPSDAVSPVTVTVRQPELWAIRRLAFTKSVITASGTGAPLVTWQQSVENGFEDPSRRKNPQYATHALHPFKGKFYAQLAKALLNISGVPLGSRILDPYCGSGTTLLEGMLNGFATFGCDLNPLATKISRAKTGVLTVPRGTAERAFSSLHREISNQRNDVPENLDGFAEETHAELASWFSESTLFRLNRLLQTIRQLDDPTMVEFAEVIASSLIREISDQDPNDLRTRRRKVHLQDVPVSELFIQKLEQAEYHLQQYWLVASKQPGALLQPSIVEGDSRDDNTIRRLGLSAASVDCVLTSPPYATALPYIDTDRLSLLSIIGVARQERTEIDHRLTGSREIRRQAKRSAEETLLSDAATSILPPSVVDQIRRIYRANQETPVGFRRANMPALLWRYFTDIKTTLQQVSQAMKPGASAFYLVGDNRTQAGDTWVTIVTGTHITSIAEMIGLEQTSIEEISVTTESYKHIKNAIKQNQIMRFRKL